MKIKDERANTLIETIKEFIWGHIGTGILISWNNVPCGKDMGKRI